MTELELHKKAQATILSLTKETNFKQDLGFCIYNGDYKGNKIAIFASEETCLFYLAEDNAISKYSISVKDKEFESFISEVVGRYGRL